MLFYTVWHLTSTAEPRFSEPLHNEVLGRANDIFQKKKKKKKTRKSAPIKRNIVTEKIFRHSFG